MDFSLAQIIILLVLLLAFLASGALLFYKDGNVTDAYRLYPNQNPQCDLARCDVSDGFNAATARDCQTVCDTSIDCEAFLYQRSGTTGGANCWPKKFKSYPPQFGAPWEQADFYLKKDRVEHAAINK